MCVAGLFVTTQPCQHRWAHLKRPCDPANNLATCPNRLKLEGWESRVDYCPFCDAHPVLPTTHRLFGNTLSASSAPASPDIPGMTRSSRSASLGTISTLSRQESGTSVDPFDRGQMHREMNDRLIQYLTTDPHEILPSARKNYPTYSASTTPSAREESTASDAASVRSASLSIARGWKRGVRFSKGLFQT